MYMYEINLLTFFGLYDVSMLQILISYLIIISDANQTSITMWSVSLILPQYMYSVYYFCALRPA
jgi:hypothetical protein